MAIEKIGVEIEVKAKNAGKAIKDVANSLNDFNKSLDKNREGLKILDQLTGGAVSQFRDFQASAKGGITAVKNLAKGFKGLKTAILTTGIGAIVIALGLIVAYWDDISDAINGVNRELENQIKKQEKQTKQLKNTISQQELSISLLKQQITLQELLTGESVNLTKELRKELLIRKQNQDQLLKELEISLELEKAKTKELGLLDKIKISLAGVTGQSASLLLFQKSTENKYKKQGDLIKKINKAKTEALNIDIEIAKIDNEEEKKREDKVKKQIEDSKKIDEVKKALEEELNKLTIKNIKDKEKRELAALESERLRARNTLVEKGANNELLLAFDTRYQQRKKEIKDKFDKEEKAKQDAKDEKRKVAEEAIEKAEQDFLNSKLEKDQLEIQSVNDKYAKLIESANQYKLDTTTLLKNQAAEIKAIEDKKDKEDIAREQALKDQKLALVADTFGQIANILGKNSAAGRAAAIAQATINTYQGVTQVWKSESILPEPLATINKVVSTATVLASGLQAVRKIKSTPKPKGLKSGGSSGGGGGGGGISVSPPSFNVVGSSGTNQLADAIATQSKEPTKAYVVSGDVTTAQEMERNTISEASI